MQRSSNNNIEEKPGRGMWHETKKQENVNRQDNTSCYCLWCAKKNRDTFKKKKTKENKKYF